MLIFADPEAKHAARLLNVDYAEAVTGFEFRGRHGTAVFKGIIVAAEYREAVEAIVGGFRDERARMEDDLRATTVIKLWKRLLVGLRIRKRIDDRYVVEGEESDPIPEEVPEVADVESDISEYVDDGQGGGFFPE